MNFTALLIKIGIFAILLVLGNFMARKKIISECFAKDTSKLMLNVFIVASIINSVLGERPDITTAEMWKAVLVLSICTAIIYATGFIASRFFKKESNVAQTEVIISVINSLFVGLPVVGALCGGEATFYIGLSCLPYNLVLYTYATGRLRGGKGKISLKEILTPPLIAAVISMVIFLVNRPMPKFFTELVGSVAGATTPLAMLLIGATLGNVNLKDLIKDPRIYIISAIRLIIVPLLTFFILKPFVTNEILLLCCVVLAGCPTGMIVTPLSIKYGYDPQYSSRMIASTTILSFITVPILVYILF